MFPECSPHVQAKASLEARKTETGFMVIRPDSGDPVEAVLEGMRMAEVAFGADTNKKGYKASGLP
jgi:nicotinamide phosphoribosyltransferase